MPHLTGEYEVALDAKGRFLLPAGFRKQLGEGLGNQFVINRGFESCLTLHTMDVWEKTTAYLSALNDFKPEVRQFKRLFLNGATIIEVDAAGRLLLPKNLTETAGIKKDMMILAQGDKTELWDKETYQQYISGHAASFSDLAALVSGDSFKKQDF